MSAYSWTHPVAWMPMLERASYGVSIDYWTHILWCECPFLNAHVAWLPILECTSCGVSAPYWTRILWCECPFLNACGVSAYSWTRILWWDTSFMNVHLLAWHERHLFVLWVTLNNVISNASLCPKRHLCVMSTTSVSWVTPHLWREQ